MKKVAAKQFDRKFVQTLSERILPSLATRPLLAHEIYYVTML